MGLASLVSRREDPTQVVSGRSETSGTGGVPDTKLPRPDIALGPGALRATPSGGPGALPRPLSSLETVVSRCLPESRPRVYVSQGFSNILLSGYLYNLTDE